MHSNEFRIIREDMERLREEVMSRVKTVRRIRAFLASPVASASLAIVLMLCASIFVSFGDVVRNIMAHGDWSDRFSYTYVSIIHARIAVQILAFLTSLACLILFTKIMWRLRTPVYFLGHFFTSRSPLKLFRS